MLKICDAMCILSSSPYYFISLWIEKKETMFSFTEKVTSKTLNIIVQSLYFQLVVKFSKFTKCALISPLINVSPVSNPVILVWNKFYQLPKKFLHLLIMHWKLEVFSSMCLKLLINSDAKRLFSIGNEVVFLVNYFTMTCSRYIFILNLYKWFTLNNLTFNAKLFANDATLFSAVHDVNTSVKVDLMTLNFVFLI